MNKFSAIKTTIDGITFASKAEARRYGQLKLLERAGEIERLELQPQYKILASNGEAVAKYIADFRYICRKRNKVVIEDVKGVKTPLFSLKKKLVEASYGIIVECVKC